MVNLTPPSPLTTNGNLAGTTSGFRVTEVGPPLDMNVLKDHGMWAEFRRDQDWSIKTLLMCDGDKKIYFLELALLMEES